MMDIPQEDAHNPPLVNHHFFNSRAHGSLSLQSHMCIVHSGRLGWRFPTLARHHPSRSLCRSALPAQPVRPTGDGGGRRFPLTARCRGILRSRVRRQPPPIGLRDDEVRRLVSGRGSPSCLERTMVAPRHLPSLRSRRW
jgi:hypothetical protein